MHRLHRPEARGKEPHLPPATSLFSLLTQHTCQLGVFMPAGLYTAPVERRNLGRLARAGADLFEVGLPYDSPFLDGPVIRSAYRRALREGPVLGRTLRAVEHAASLRPTVLMTYWDPVTRHGPEDLVRLFADAGAAGVMVVDLPDGEAGAWHELTAAAGLTAPRLTPPAVTDRQLQAICRTASGWLYAPASGAATGYRGPLDLAALAAAVRRLRSMGTLPVVSGVGISTPRLAAAVAPLVDAVVIGTPVVEALGHGIGRASATTAAFARALRTARS